MQLEPEKYRSFYQLHRRSGKWHRSAPMNAVEVLVQNDSVPGMGSHQARPQGMRLRAGGPSEQEMSCACCCWSRKLRQLSS